MRYSLKEGVLFGVIIALAVLLIRAFGGGMTIQFVALLVVAGVLAAVQFVLSLRRARSRDDSAPPLRAERPSSGRRAQPQDPFAHETNQAWTGLNSTIVQEQEQREDAGSTAEDSSSEYPQLGPKSSRDNPPTANHRSL